MELERCQICYKEKRYLLKIVEQYYIGQDEQSIVTENDYICLSCAFIMSANEIAEEE